MSEAIGVAEIEKSLEVEIVTNMLALKRPAAVSCAASAEREMTADNLGTLFRRMAKLAIEEIEILVDELHRLRTKLEIDSDLIERAITQHAHSQGVMELTTIIADNVKRLP